MPHSPPKESPIKIFNMKRGNYEAMRKEVKEYEWNLHNKTSNEINNIIKDVIYTSMEKNIPKTKKKNKKNQPGWLDNKTLRKIKKKHKLFQRYLLTKEGTDYLKFIQARKKCKRAIKTAKREYERKVAKHSKSNPRQFWRYVNEKLKVNSGISPLDKEDGSKATEDKDKASILNKYLNGVFLSHLPSDGDAELCVKFGSHSCSLYT